MLWLPDGAGELPLTDASPSAAFTVPACPCLALPCPAHGEHRALHSTSPRSGCHGPRWWVWCWAEPRAVPSILPGHGGWAAWVPQPRLGGTGHHWGRPRLLMEPGVGMLAYGRPCVEGKREH